MLGYADRTNLSVAVIAMSREFGWGEASTGTLLASFFCGYVLTQIPAGLAAARFGAKRVLLVGTVVWSAATVLTPWAARQSINAALAARVVVGLAEGVQIPCCNALLAAWVPPHGRARALSFIFSGQFVGTICALSCSPLAEWWWPSIFLLWGWLGFVWCLVFAALAPASSPGASAGKGAAGEELGLISAVDGSGSPRCSASAPRCARPAFLAHPAFLAVCAAHFANNWGAYLLLSWLPNTPYAVAIVADNVGGWVADEVLLSRCRLKLLHARKSMQAVAMLMWGVVNTIGTVPGIAANVVTGRVLAAAPTAAAGAWVRVFSTGAAIYVCGLTAFLALAQALPLPTSGAEKAGSCGAGGLLGPKPAR
ncbi:hypothetical protein EMIHUDRAFT_448586 [Emiliania huxleyi CCMP1516]|uniref:Major facilitator superfamily (MFS) profile domain-containing protein n=2 Tax=Emiliania huxleyi TaxID=2903 RepID=A0A0D3I1V4_EMIH1|nr:hypothetical protein EMIHUDRAFT_448586 [Emiliania huxleyi CCMP1516]EOD05239.1 hypothetical protein EMIHUDRAFT_448586 [Emiliania huxleyi CCMP1516]|eukprot:XP_005757668.1 hypothetical protein EMIHUDRAFT_448586 [Emiliania huxleyi CCMP1516]